MKKLLIICEFFEPSSMIAATRPTKLAKYLHLEQEYEVTVFMRRVKEAQKRKKTDVHNYVKETHYVPSFCHLLRVIYFPPRAIRKIVVALLSKIAPHSSFYQNVSHKLNGLVGRVCEQLDYQEGKKQGKWIAKQVRESGESYDVIFSTYAPYYTVFAGELIKANQPDCFWVCDFRDSINRGFASSRMEKKLEIFMDKHCQGADLITAVSQGVLDDLPMSLDVIDEQKRMVLPNGYDPEEVLGTTQSDDLHKTEGLIFVYTGMMYVGRRDLSPFFQAIRELLDAKEIEEQKIRIYYAGFDGEVTKNQAARYYIQDLVKDFGYISKDDSLLLQHKGDIMLLASWNSQKSQGIVTGKIYEYMMMKKPIVATVMGDLAKSEIKNMMEEMDLGFCFEEMTKAQDFNSLKTFIVEQYKHKEVTGKVRYFGNEEKIAGYQYNRIASTLANVINMKRGIK